MVAAQPRLCFWVLSFLYLDFHFAACLNQEGTALLSFKAFIKEDPDGSLSDWNASDPNPCAWNGITCRDGGVVSVSIPRRKLAGNLHPALGALSSLRHVNLRSNRLYGNLPPELCRAGGLQSLVLYGNSLSGHIPPHIGNLSYLQILDLSQNSFNGLVPASLLKCERLRVLYLSHNLLEGFLPAGFGNSLIGLEKLNLSYNQFEGSIPGDIGNLSNLQDTVDFSHNIFSGSIPPSLGNLPEKIYIDLSYNNLSGPIPQNGALLNRGPTAFLGNPGLCGPPLKTQCPANGSSGGLAPTENIPAAEAEGGYPSRIGDHRGLTEGGVIAIVVSDLLGMLAIALLFLCLYRRATISRGKEQGGIAEKGQKKGGGKECLCFRKDGSVTPSDNARQSELVPLDPGVKFNLDELLKASAFVLGKSGIGIVYKVVLEDGLTLAVRRLGEGGSQRFKEFQIEVEAIAKPRHPNIVALRAYYWSVEEKLLVYDYIPNGNLSTAIHGKPDMMEFSPLSWSVRLNIIKGVARGLTYLHEFSPKKYVHGDLKPNNILLDDNWEPYISDFGIGRLAHIAGGFPIEQSNRMIPEKAHSQSSGVLSPVMDIGFYYQAPESLKTLKPSQKWDVYSFGVMLLELITGRTPVLVIGSSEMSLVHWVQFCINEKMPLSEILDPYLSQELESEDVIISVLKTALTCVHASPERRSSMRNVSESLQRLSSK